MPSCVMDFITKKLCLSHVNVSNQKFRITIDGVLQAVNILSYSCHFLLSSLGRLVGFSFTEN